MNAVWCRWTLLLLATFVSQGCVSVHAPLLADEQYPSDWGEILPLGPECKGIEGTYANSGWLTGPGGSVQPVSLMGVLNLAGDANAVSLRTSTRRIDQNGDAFVTLQVSAHGASRDRESCFCIKQTLVCTQIAGDHWSVPNFGFGGSQRNAYFAITRDRALVAKLQNYHADVLLAVPVFGMKEPWARFNAIDR